MTYVHVLQGTNGSAGYPINPDYNIFKKLKKCTSAVRSTRKILIKIPLYKVRDTSIASATVFVYPREGYRSVTHPANASVIRYAHKILQ